ncbi:MAG TPA: helix-turn-helix domain-containing protein [Candidatus Sulfotelmatobacter sp.]
MSLADAAGNRVGSSSEELSYVDCLGPLHVDCIDYVVREGQMIPGTEDVADSWRRCLTANHLDPNNSLAPEIITENEIKVSTEPLHNLIFHAQDEIDRLYAIVGPQDYVVLLCNRDGVAIHHRGDESKAEAFKYWGIWLGGVWSEEVEGTNGIGTCIAEQRPEMVHRGQHFRTRHTELSCAGAPIFDPLGRLTAVLDTSSMDPKTSEQSLSLVMAATKVSARGIEERMFREHFRSAWNVAAAPSGVTDSAVLLAVDNDQRILGADQMARRLLGLNDEALNRGKALSSVFEYNPSLFRAKWMRDIPARLLKTGANDLNTGTIEPWNVLITRPVAGWWSQTEALIHFRPRIDMLANLPAPITPKNYGGLSPATANRIREYIDSHLQENIALEVLAGIAQLSVHHFAREFRQSVGVSPHSYIVRRRVERAKELLRTTDLSLSEIANASGFADQSHFTRHFRRLTGISPGLARRHNGKNN